MTARYVYTYYDTGAFGVQQMPYKVIREMPKTLEVEDRDGKRGRLRKQDVIGTLTEAEWRDF